MSPSLTDHPGPIALIGIGEMGGVFARGFLRTGHAVYPVLRSTPMEDVASQVPDPLLALVAVGESDLTDVMGAMPPAWRPVAGLIQNELLPRDWRAAGIDDPTVAVVWFEKKPGRDVKVIIPSPVHGPRADVVTAALDAVGIPTVVTSDGHHLEFELIRKNLYILTANIAGLVTGGTVGELWTDHRPLAQRVAAEVLDIQEWLVGHAVDRAMLIDGMVEAFTADPEHGATGRSAPSRLHRALGHAAEAGIDVPVLEAIERGEAPDA